MGKTIYVILFPTMVLYAFWYGIQRFWRKMKEIVENYKQIM